MGRVIATVPDGMEKELKELADQRGAPLATVVREAFQDYLAKQGKQVKAGVSWGGKRPAKNTRAKASTTIHKPSAETLAWADQTVRELYETGAIEQTSWWKNNHSSE